MHASQSSGAVARTGRPDAFIAAMPVGLLRGTWRSVVDLVEDLVILGQFAFGRDYRSAKPRNA